MILKNAKPCPFCGQVPRSWDLIELSDGAYTLSHHCPHKKDALTICLNVYGKTKEEVVDLWNHRSRGNRKQKQKEKHNEKHND